MKKPTVDKIIKERDSRVLYYAALHEQQIKDDGYYELTYDSGIPTNLGITQRTPKTAREWVETGVRHFTMDNPRAIVPAESRTDRSRQRAAKLETFYNAWLEKLPITLKQSAKKLLKRGEVFLKLWIDDYYYGINREAKGYDKEKVEDRALTHFPLIMTLPDPINVFCSPAHNGLAPVDVIEFYEMTVAEVENLCDNNNWNWSNKDNKKSTDKVKWTSYYDDTKRCFLVENEPILSPEVAPNILGFCPYIHIPSGLGDTNYEGKPEYLYRSIIYANEEMIDLWTRAVNQMDAITARYAWPRPKLSGPEADVERLYGDGFSMNPSEPIIETDTVKVTFEQGQAAPPQAYQHLAMLQELAEPSPVLSGNSPSGVYSGTHFQSEVSQARPLYKDPLKNLEDGIALFLGMGARAIEVIDHPISVREYDKEAGQSVKQIGPDDIKGYYYVKMSMKAELPEAADMRKTMGMNAHKAGILPHKRVLTEYFDMSEEEAEDMIAELVSEGFLKNPIVQEAVVRDVAKRWGMDIVQKILDEMGMQTARGGDNRNPEQFPTGLDSIPSRGRMGGMEGMPGKAELAMLPGGQ